MTEQTATIENTSEIGENTSEIESENTSEEETEEEPETFPRKVVEDLRKENAAYRVKAARADVLAERLHTALVTATGRLADPSDLPFEEAQLEDAAALDAALDALLARKPHLASRRPSGNVGQGATSTGNGTVDLGGMLRQRA